MKETPFAVRKSPREDRPIAFSAPRTKKAQTVIDFAAAEFIFAETQLHQYEWHIGTNRAHFGMR
jgi:LDH2 family malate/lactate/ureidoglycolate dehydrogenase